MKGLNYCREKFSVHLGKQHSLRLHMFFIILATVCSGLLATKLLHAMHMENVAVRYPLSVAFAYLVFFISVRIWLHFIVDQTAVCRPRGRSGNTGDTLADISADIADLNVPGGNSPSVNAFQGGDSGGGGADASFSAMDGVFRDGNPVILDDGTGGGGGAGEAVSGLADGLCPDIDEGVAVIVVFAVLALVLAAVVGIGIYVIYDAPFILSEAAFQFFLAAGLLRGARRMEDSDWIGSVFKATWISFALTVLLALAAGLLIHHFFPAATSVNELFRMLR